MKVNEAIMKISKVSNAQNVKLILETKKYLPYLQKKQLVERVVNQCSCVENGYIKINELDKYVIFIINVIQAYTNIEFDVDINTAIQEYDLLCSNDVLGTIIDTFESEYQTILELLKMQTYYILQNNNIEYQIAKLVHLVQENANRLFEDYKDIADRLDVNEIQVGVNSIQEFIAQYCNNT